MSLGNHPNVLSGGVITPPALGASDFANPTATIGATAVNGTALTAMRSDAAPALGVTQTLNTITASASTNLTLNAGATGNNKVIINPTSAGTNSGGWLLLNVGAVEPSASVSNGQAFQFSSTSSVFLNGGFALNSPYSFWLQTNGTYPISLNPIGGNVLIGTKADNSNGLLQFPASTSANAGIACGNDTPSTNLYRSAASTLKTDASLALGGKATTYNGVATAGWGVPAIYAAGRVTAQTSATASISTYTVGAADGSFIVSANINVTAATTASFTCTCTYTDETNTSRTLTLNFSNVTGTLLTTITNATGTGAYEGVPLHIRAKASTAITFATVGTFTSATYNAEGI